MFQYSPHNMFLSPVSELSRNEKKCFLASFARSTSQTVLWKHSFLETVVTLKVLLHLPRSVTTSSVTLNPTFLHHLLIWSFCWSFLICKTYFELALQTVAHELEVELWLLKCGLTHSSARVQQGNRGCALFCFFSTAQFWLLYFSRCWICLVSIQ